MKKLDYLDVTEMIRRKTQLEQELENTQRKIGRLSNSIPTLQIKLKDEKKAILGFKSPEYQAEMNSRMNNIQAIENDLNAANTELEQLNTQIIALRTQINACEDDVNLANVLDHQNAITAKNGELMNFQQLIADQQNAITEAGAPKDLVTPLIDQREELLADIALGLDTTANLDSLDKQIATAREEQKRLETIRKNTIAHAQQTIAGLERRMATAQDEMNRLNKITPKIFDLLFMSMAKLTANEFNALAEQLAEKMLELLALDELVLQMGQRKDSGLFHGTKYTLSIPQINGFKALDYPRGMDGLYAKIAKYQTPIDDIVSKVKQSLINRGVDI